MVLKNSFILYVSQEYYILKYSKESALGTNHLSHRWPKTLLGFSLEKYLKRRVHKHIKKKKHKKTFNCGQNSSLSRKDKDLIHCTFFFKLIKNIIF